MFLGFGQGGLRERFFLSARVKERQIIFKSFLGFPEAFRRLWALDFAVHLIWCVSETDGWGVPLGTCAQSVGKWGHFFQRSWMILLSPGSAEIWGVQGLKHGGCFCTEWADSSSSSGKVDASMWKEWLKLRHPSPEYNWVEPSSFKLVYLFIWFLDHTWKCSELTPDSNLTVHSCGCSGNPLWCQG